MLPLSPSALKVLLVDDNGDGRLALGAELRHAGHHVLETDSAYQALTLFTQHRPDLVLLDVDMAAHDGYALARELRAAEPGAWTPVVFLTEPDDAESVWLGMQAGGDDYLIKPVSALVLHAKLRAISRLSQLRQQLVQVSEELRLAHAQLQQSATIDILTGLLNRRGLDARLQTELELARRGGKPLTLVLCDLDHFKGYNDALGQASGNHCLQQVAQVLRDVCKRPTDIPCRFGDDEFALLLPNTPLSGAIAFAHTLMRGLQQLAIAHPCSPVAPYVTVSGGVTTCVPDAQTTGQGLLMHADEALYNAKARGRNRFFSFEIEMDTNIERDARRLDT